VPRSSRDRGICRELELWRQRQGQGRRHTDISTHTHTHTTHTHTQHTHTHTHTHTQEIAQRSPGGALLMIYNHVRAGVPGGVRVGRGKHRVRIRRRQRLCVSSPPSRPSPLGAHPTQGKPKSGHLVISCRAYLAFRAEADSRIGATKLGLQCSDGSDSGARVATRLQVPPASGIHRNYGVKAPNVEHKAEGRGADGHGQGRPRGCGWARLRRARLGW